MGSHLRMFDFFTGVPKRLIVDNLKAGVLKADLYLPQLNRAYQEMAEHHGCFIDPARPYHPKDKAKVERTVPVVREFFRKYKALDPTLDLACANRQARSWCLETNGLQVHGTTGLKPFEVFQQMEKTKLQPLPLHPFEVPTWKAAKVHVDRFIQFEMKTYGACRSDWSGISEALVPSTRTPCHAQLSPGAGTAQAQKKYPREQLNQVAEYAAANHIHTPRQV